MRLGARWRPPAVSWVTTYLSSAYGVSCRARAGVARVLPVARSDLRPKGVASRGIGFPALVCGYTGGPRTGDKTRRPVLAASRMTGCNDGTWFARQCHGTVTTSAQRVGEITGWSARVPHPWSFIG